MAQPLSSAKPSDLPVISEQRILIPNKYGEKLAGVLHQTGSKKLVILCHGFRASKEDNIIVNLTASLTSQGISTFSFDFAGNGESEGEFQYGNYRREADDLRAVISYLSEQKHEIAAIIGHSKGGNVVLLYASMYHDVPIVINCSGRFALDRGIEGRLGKEFMQRIKRDGFIDVKDKTGKIEYRVTEDSLMDRLSTDMHAASLSIDKECRVFTIHGSEDEIIPVEDALEFAKLIPNLKLHIVEGANHCYSAHQQELASLVVDFLKSNQVGDAS
uniref:Serine aminopeptidase S33 domain-containing protein n=1 Tax=Ananas comosus var. bracteatus TaxID=296719 RepID=A0A6V7QTS8_ANACO